MANLNLLVTIPASGKINIAAALPQKTGGKGNLASDLTGPGNIFAQQIIFQNQGSSSMWIGDATTTSTNGLLLTATGSANFGSFINYGSFLSDWWVVGTAGQQLFVLYIQ